MKNIVYIGKYNGIIGGIERYMQKSAELLKRNGFAVHCLYTENGGREQKQFAAAFDSIAEFSTECNLLANADLIVIHNIVSADMLQKLPADKTFFFAHDHNIYCRRHHYYTPLGRKNCHRKYNALRCLICSMGRNEAPPIETYRKFPALVLSDFMADNLRKNGFKKVIKLPAFIKIQPTERKIMPNGVLRILFLGQLIRGKGADLMLKTLNKLDIPFECTIAGDGNDRAMLEKMTADFNLQDKVHFAGFVNDSETLWQNCDVLFFPIRWQEPFGLVSLEAFSHGIPVVAFDLGGIREYLSDQCGALIPELDIAAAAQILKQLYLQPERLQQLGNNAIQIAENKFSEEIFVNKFKLLTEVLK